MAVDIASICSAIRQSEQVLDREPRKPSVDLQFHNQLLKNQILILKTLADIHSHARGFPIGGPPNPPPTP